MKENKFIFLLCGLNFIFCLAGIFFFSNPIFVPGHEYTDIARNIAAGRGYVGSGFFHLKYAPSAFLTPVYSYFLATLIRIFDLPNAFLIARIFNALLNALILILIYVLAREVFDKETANIASIIFAFYFPFVGWTVEIWDTLLFVLCLLFLVLLLIK
ncbi:MAG: glycosyltransferase family 39 protein, partial [Candidatus Margulisiibacteriota bacterium]